MKRTVTYNQITHEPDHELTKAWSFRVWRIEPCIGWFHGPLPTWFYFNPCGRLHAGTVALTLRVFRFMIGGRWYL